MLTTRHLRTLRSIEQSTLRSVAKPGAIGRAASWRSCAQRGGMHEAFVLNSDGYEPTRLCAIREKYLM